MLPDLDTAVDAESVKENLQAVQAIYFAYMLEEMRVYQVVERIAQLFQQGLLPAAEGSAAKLLRQRVLEPSRLSALGRGQLYSRVIGARDAPSGTARAVEPIRMFLSLWLRFVVSVAVYARQHDANSLLAPHAADTAGVRRAARALAPNASAHGAGAVHATARRLTGEVQAMITLLRDPEIVTAFGSRDMWQVIDHVNRRHLGGAANVARYRTQAEAGSVVLQWLAAHADQLDSATQTETGESPTDADLRMAVEQWLAASSVADDSVEEDSHPGESPSVTCPPVVLPAIAHDLLRAVGLLANGLSPLGGTGNAGSDAVDRSRGVVALFHGAAGTGKTLAAHLLAAALSRDIYRVDLGQMVSKYIGETERNLDTVFARAEETGAVLFLDEADALFGRRSEVKDSHDRYANAEAAYLLQRIEAFEGVMVLATNLLPEMGQVSPDADWRRRFRHVVCFPRPRP